MKHTPRILLTALIAAGASAAPKTTARTNSENFEGFSISLGGSQVTQSGSTLIQELYQEVTFNANASEGSGGTGPYNNPDTYDVRSNYGARSFYNKDAFNGQVALAYNLGLTENFLIGLEVAMQFGASTRFVSIAAIPGPDNDINEHIETSNTWSVALKPSYTISDKFMVYAKVSRASAKISGNVDLQVANTEGLLVDALSFNRTVSGLGLGLGFEYNLDAHWFLQGEIERIAFNSYKKTRTTGTYYNGNDGSYTVGDVGAPTGNSEFYRGSADIGVNLSKATISLGYRF